MSAAFVPTFTRHDAEGKADAWRLAKNVLTALMVSPAPCRPRIAFAGR